MAYVKDKWYLSRILYIYGLKPLYVFGRFICILCNKYGGVLWTFSFLVMMKQVKSYCHRNTSLDSKSVLLSITSTSTLVLRRGDIDAVAQGELDTTGIVVFLFANHQTVAVEGKAVNATIKEVVAC